MAKLTALSYDYWRYQVKTIGRTKARNKFLTVIEKAKGFRKHELLETYRKVFLCSE